MNSELDLIYACPNFKLHHYRARPLKKQDKQEVTDRAPNNIVRFMHLGEGSKPMGRG